MLSWIVGLALVAGAFGQYKWDPTGQYRLVPDETALRALWIPKFFENRLVNTPIELIEPWRTVVMSTLPDETKVVDDVTKLGRQYKEVTQEPKQHLGQYKEVWPETQYKQHLGQYKEVWPETQYKQHVGQYKEITPEMQHKQYLNQYRDITPPMQYKQYLEQYKQYFDQHKDLMPEMQYKQYLDQYKDLMPEIQYKQYLNQYREITPEMQSKQHVSQYKEIKPEMQYREEPVKSKDMMMMDEEEKKCMNMGICTPEIIERIKMKSPNMLETLCRNKGLGCKERQWWG